MTERLNEARKYLELYKISPNRSEEANTYRDKVLDILKAANETTINEQEAKEALSLTYEICSVIYHSTNLNKYHRPDYRSYFSCVIDRTGKVYWLKNTMDYRDIIDAMEGYNPIDIDSITAKMTKILKDLENLDDLGYHRVRIVPKDTKKVTRNREDWEFDWIGMVISPTWYRENRKQYEENCWKCWEESTKINLAIDNENIVVRDTFILATGNAKVEAHGNAKVVAWNNATVDAYDNAIVVACGNARVDANDSSVVETNNGHVRVRAYDNSVVEAMSYEEVMANDNSIVRSHLHATVHAEENARVEAYDHTTVETRDNATVIAYGMSVIEAWGGVVEAHDSAIVHRCWSDAKIAIKSKYAIIIDGNIYDNTAKIIVSKDAVVERE